MGRLFNAFRLIFAPVRGPLFIVVIVTSTVFAMATGIVGAAVTVLGIMAAPDHDQDGLRREALCRGDHRGRHARHPDSAVGDADRDGAGARRIGGGSLRGGFRARVHARGNLPRLSAQPLFPESPSDRRPARRNACIRFRRPARVRHRRRAAACAHRSDARNDSGRRRDADRGFGDRRAGRNAACRRLPKADFRRHEPRCPVNDRHDEHGPVPRRHLERLRRRVRAPRHASWITSRCPHCRCRRWRCWCS